MMKVSTLTIVECREEGQPPVIFIDGSIPLQRAGTLIQNFIIEAAKEVGRKEAGSMTDNSKKMKRSKANAKQH